jgi:hypothetical protein
MSMNPNDDLGDNAGVNDGNRHLCRWYVFLSQILFFSTNQMFFFFVMI